MRSDPRSRAAALAPRARWAHLVPGVVLATLVGFVAEASAQHVTDDRGNPITGTVATEQIREMLDQREAKGDDVSRAREAWSQIEAQGYVEVENLDPTDLVLPREIRESTYLRHQQRGVSRQLLEAEYHYAVDQSLVDIARVAGVDEGFLHRFFYDDKPLPARVVRQIEAAGYTKDEIEALRDPNRAASLTEQLRAGGAPESYIDALRGP